MVAVVFDDGFLHDANNLDDYLRLNTTMVEDGSGPRQTRMNAAGVVRIVESPGVARAFNLTFDLCDRDTYEQLRAWADSLLLFRGRRVAVYGAYDGKSYQIDHYPASDLAVVSVRFVVSG